MNPLRYLYEYIKINEFFIYLLVLLGALALIPRRGKPILSARPLLALILVLGLVLRILWLGFSSHVPQMSWNDHLLENDHINIHAIELTKGIWFHDASGLPDGRRPIGYPLFLGLLYKLFGVHTSVAWISNLTLFAAGALLLFLIGQSIFSDRVGLTAAFFYAVYPVSIYATKLITDENLFLPVWYLGLYLLLWDIKKCPSWPRLALYSLIFGYATIVRTHPIFMPFVVALAYGLRGMPVRKIFSAFILCGLLMQLPNIPWIIRNVKAWGVPVLYTPTSPFIYAQVNATALPEGGGHIPKRGEPGFSEDLERAIAAGNPGMAHQIANREMKRWIVQHPKEFLSLAICRVLYFMNWNRQGGVWPIWFQYDDGAYDPKRPLDPKSREILEEWAFLAYYIALFSFILSLIGIRRSWTLFSEDTKRGILVLLSCFLFWFLEHLVIYPDRKYRYPLEPLMILFASYFFDAIRGRISLNPIAAKFKKLFLEKAAT